MEIHDPNELALGRFDRRSFVSVAGQAGFEKGFEHKTHGLTARYFLVRPSGWQIGALILAAAVWCVMFYFFFLWRRKRRGGRQAEPPNLLSPP